MTAAVRLHDRGPLHLADWCAPMRWRGVCRHIGEGTVNGQGDDLQLHLTDGTTAAVVKLWVYAEEVPELGRFCTHCLDRLRTTLNDRILLLAALDEAATDPPQEPS